MAIAHGLRAHAHHVEADKTDELAAKEDGSRAMRQRAREEIPTCDLSTCDVLVMVDKLFISTVIHNYHRSSSCHGSRFG